MQSRGQTPTTGRSAGRAFSGAWATIPGAWLATTRPTVRSCSASGRQPASKQKGPAGNERPGHYAFGSRSADSAADDVNLTLALLASFSRSYDESFARALLDPAYGKELLKGKAYKEWKVIDAAKNSPVLVEYFYRRKSSRAGLKHHKDKLAPGLADIDNLYPLGNPPRNWLMEVGKAAGLQCDLGTAHLRRSHAMKERLHGKTSVPEMVKNLCHRAGQTHLHQDVYTAEMDPETHAKMANAADQSAPVRGALQGVHAVPGRPTLADVDGDILKQSGREGGRAIGGKYCRTTSRRRSVLTSRRCAAELSLSL